MRNLSPKAAPGQKADIYVYTLAGKMLSDAMSNNGIDIRTV